MKCRTIEAMYSLTLERAVCFVSRDTENDTNCLVLNIRPDYINNAAMSLELIWVRLPLGTYHTHR